MMFTTTDGCLVLLLDYDREISCPWPKPSPWHPRWRYYALRCFGRKRHYRKNGTCRHTDEVLARIKPNVRPRVLLEASQ